MQPTIMVRRNVARVLIAGALAGAACACGASSTTEELSDARKAYDEAVESPAATYRPGELTNAREALDRAEDAHHADPGSQREARLASAAERQADVAKADGEAVARERAAEIERAEAKRAGAEQRKDNGAALAKSADRIDKEGVPEQPSPKLIESREGNERSTRASAALQGLSQVATVKEESRGIVITMSGSLLFPSGQSELTPIARQNLDQVSDAIALQPNDTQVRVEGYTDAQGPEQQNRRLSAKRAQAVADHLIARGVDRDRVSVVGRGEADPIADNDSAEGRANNRRVEIVLGKRNDEKR